MRLSLKLKHAKWLRHYLRKWFAFHCLLKICETNYKWVWTIILGLEKEIWGRSWLLEHTWKNFVRLQYERFTRLLLVWTTDKRPHSTLDNVTSSHLSLLPGSGINKKVQVQRMLKTKDVIFIHPESGARFNLLAQSQRSDGSYVWYEERIRRFQIPKTHQYYAEKKRTH